MRLGLLGGSFNPIHRCHLAIAQSARQRLPLDRVLFIPTGDPPHKQSSTLADARHRYQMVQLAIQHVPEFVLTDIEIRRTGKSYSIDTVRAIQQEYGSDTSLFFIIGLDAFVDLPSWKEADLLLKTCNFVVISRPSTKFLDLAAIPFFNEVPQVTLDALDAAKQDRADVPLTNGRTLTFLRLPPCESSASEIRARIHAGRPLANLLPAQVESYILREGLYREDGERF